MKRIRGVLGLLAFVALPAHAGTLDYGYDSMGRLAAAVDSRSATETATSIYRYDTAGNRSEMRVVLSGADLVPVFRFYKADSGRFYSLSYMEGFRANLTSGGRVFNLYRNAAGDRVELFRCYWSYLDDHYLSASSSCDGHTVEGSMGFAKTSSATGTVPLYRFWKASTGDHLVTTNYQEGIDGGYADPVILGYVP